MKTNQINFFFMPEDIAAIDDYLHSHKILIVSQPMQTDQLRIVNSISLFETDLDKKLNKKYLIPEVNQSQITVKQIKEQNYFLINDLISPCVEVVYSPFSQLKDKSMNRGRFYYNKTFYNAKKELVSKNENFLEFASSFFKWIKKNFKNSKLKGFEDFLVSERTKNWVNSGGMLLENYNLSSKFQQEKISQKVA
jgi:hypothetical protein